MGDQWLAVVVTLLLVREVLSSILGSAGHRYDVSGLPRRLAVVMGPATYYTLLHNTASIIKF